MSQTQIKTDKEGFLIDRHAWTPELGQALAQKENIQLSAEHWEIIHAAQSFYAQFDLSPAMRPFIKYLKTTLDKEVNSIYLLKLFPQSPAKLASKIAGLPKPKNCL